MNGWGEQGALLAIGIGADVGRGGVADDGSRTVSVEAKVRD